MYWIDVIFKACQAIMSIQINLFGYYITLTQVLLYGFLLFVLTWFIFRLLR